jgi:hypothetical protein
LSFHLQLKIKQLVWERISERFSRYMVLSDREIAGMKVIKVLKHMQARLTFAGMWGCGDVARELHCDSWLDMDCYEKPRRGLESPDVFQDAQYLH